MGEQDERLNVRIPKDLKATAMAKAEAAGITLSAALRLLLETWVKPPPPKED